MFGCQVDQPIRSCANVVATGGRVVVKVRTYPSGSFHGTLEGCAKVDVFALWNHNCFFDMIVLDATGDNYFIFARV